MVAGYTRQSAANIQPGLRCNAEDVNAEYNQLATAFDNTAGHDHSGSVAGDGAKISLTTSVSGVLPLVNGGTGSSTGAQATGTFAPGGVLVGSAGSPPAAGQIVLNQNSVAGPGLGPGYNLPALYAVAPSGGANAQLVADAFGGGGGDFIGRSARGTASAPTATQSGDNLAIFGGIGRGATTYGAAYGAAVQLEAAQNWNDTQQGSQIAFQTVFLNSVTPVNSLVLQGNSATFSGTGTFLGQQVVIGPQSGIDTAVVLNATAGGHQWQVVSKGTAPVGEFWVYDFTAGALRLEITATGTCNAATAWGIVSDARVKRDVVDHPHGLREILQLQPRRFSYNGEHGLEGEGSGLVAQELEAVMPELVREMPTADGGVVKTVVETGILWPLINAVKALKWEIEQLKAKAGA